MNWQSFPAPAKLNLFLHVVGRRPDGYHLLQTAFTFIDLEDRIDIAISDDGVIRRDGDIPGVPEDSDLTVRAARLLQRHTGCRQGAAIRVTKNIPMGGGVGGGSSDAATVLLALNHLWGTGLKRSELQTLGLELGADVPVFVFGQSAFAEGVGEALVGVELPEQWYVLLIPPVTVPTADIFRDPLLTRDTKPVTIAVFQRPGFDDLKNDLQPVACRLFPQVSRALDWLSQHEDPETGKARMTGSGACVFAPFASREAAEAVLWQIPADLQGCVVRSYNRHPLHGLISD